MCKSHCLPYSVVPATTSHDVTPTSPHGVTPSVIHMSPQSHPWSHTPQPGGSEAVKEDLLGGEGHQFSPASPPRSPLWPCRLPPHTRVPTDRLPLPFLQLRQWSPCSGEARGLSGRRAPTLPLPSSAQHWALRFSHVATDLGRAFPVTPGLRPPLASASLLPPRPTAGLTPRP